MIAGLLVPGSKLTHVRRAVERIETGRRQHGGEVKGKKLLKSPKGLAALTDFLTDVTQAGCLPIFQTWEKRYCIAAKLVETLFDPFHNPRAEWLPTGANIDRKDLANWLLEVLPGEHLVQFAEVYRKPSLEGFVNVIERLALAFEKLGEFRLAETVRGNSAATLLDAEDLGDDEVSRSALVSLNYPAFVQVVRGGALAVPSDTARLEVVHDETKEFKTAFERGFGYLRTLDDSRWIVLQDGRPRMPGIRDAASFRTGVSEQEPELRAADYLATAVRGIGEAACLGKVERVDLYSLAVLLVPILIYGEHFAGALGSPSFLGGHMALLKHAVDAGHLDSTGRDGSRRHARRK